MGMRDRCRSFWDSASMKAEPVQFRHSFDIRASSLKPAMEFVLPVPAASCARWAGPDSDPISRSLAQFASNDASPSANQLTRR